MTDPNRTNPGEADPSRANGGWASAQSAGGVGRIFARSDGAPSSALDDLRRSPLTALWRRRWITIVCAVLGALVGYVVYAVTKPVYEGRARILVSQSGPKVLQQDFPGTLSSGAMWLNTQCEIIRSPAILSAVAADPRVKELATFRRHPELASNIAGFLSAATYAAPGQRNEIITVAVRGPVPEDAAWLANAVVGAYQKFNDDLKKSSATEVAKFLRDAKERNDRELDKKYRERLDFQRANAGLSFSDTRNPVLERVNSISAYLTAAELESVKLQAEADTIQAILDKPERVRELLSNPQYRGETYAMRRELREMQTTLELLSATYLPGSARVAAQVQRMERTKEEVEAEERAAAQAILGEVTRRLDAKRQEVAQYRKWLNDEQANVLQVNTRQADFALIQAEIGRMERYSEQLADQLKSINLAESAGAMNVFVMGEASTNPVPVYPDRMRSVFYGLVAGILAGVALSMLREFTDTRLRSADDIKHALALPILGIVPHIRGGGRSGVAQRGRAVALEPMSDVAEAYRTVRTAVYFGSPGGAVRSLLVTSPAPGDGKTTLASNLAIAMAQAGNRVVLLDCDFRKPSQHKVFEVDRRHGLSNVLAGEMPLEQATVSTGTPGLSLLPCGPIPSNPSEILNGQGFADLLARLTAEFDQVIIDSPPVLPVTDARVLAASCDGILLAVRAERSTRPAATQARDLLLSVGGRILGIVVNDVPRRRAVYGYYFADEGRYAYYGVRRAGAAPSNGARSTNGDRATAGVDAAPEADAGRQHR